MTVTFLDVGQGDSILIETPNLNKILIDTSPNESVIRQLSKQLSYYDKKIDSILITHADLDHVGGTPDILRKYLVGDFLYAFDMNTSALTREIHKMNTSKSKNEITLKAGDRIILDGKNNIYLDMLWPHPEYKNDDKNENSIVTRLVYDEVSFMLTGDAGKEVENYLLNIYEDSQIKSDVLKLGHHGSKTSTAESFVKTVSPQYAIVSAGEDNKFGHPHSEVLNTVRNMPTDIPIRETKNGPVIFQTDGRYLYADKFY
jgi:competence protein ComEC